MKRFFIVISALLTAIILFSITIFALNNYYDTSSSIDKQYLRYSYSAGKNMSHDAMVKTDSEKTILLLGSSELSSSDGYAEHPRLLLNYDNINIALLGKAYYQSFNDALILGSIYDTIPTKKPINIFLSIQWFYNGGIANQAFQSCFSLDHWMHFVKNPRIDLKTKKAVYERLKQLLAGDHIRLNQINIIWKGTYGNYFDKAVDKNLENIITLNTNKALVEEANKTLKPNPPIKSAIDWQSLRKQANESGKKETSNNDKWVENNYWDTYIKKDYKSFKGSQKNISLKNSKEFEDLKLMLKVADDLGVKVNLFLIPLPAKWSEYAEFPVSEYKYYNQQIKDIASKNPNVVLYDYSKHSNTPYFFKDIMHLGHVGWTYILPDLLEANGYGRYNKNS